MKKVMLILVVVLLSGCAETQKQWGKGDLPTGYIKNFGNSNLARLSHVVVQSLDRNTKILDEVAKRIIAIESKPDDLARIEGLETKVRDIKASIAKLEEEVDPNDPTIEQCMKLYRLTLEKLETSTALGNARLDVLEARPIYDPNECVCLEIGEPIYRDLTFTETVPCEVTE